MARTGAERQSAYLARQREHLAALESENDRLRRRAGELEVANERLRRTVDALSAALEAQDDGQPSGLRCAHPSESVENGRCGICREWL